MPYNPPGTINTADVITAAYLNAYVRDNPAYLKGVIDGTGTDRIPGRALGLVSARRTQSQVVSVPNNTLTPLYFDTVEFDDGGFTSAFTDRLTIPKTGYYLFGVTLMWFISPTGQRHVEMNYNSTATLRQQRIPAVGDSQRTPNALVDYRKLNAGDILTCMCSQTSGGALSLDVGPDASSFWIALAKDNS